MAAIKPIEDKTASSKEKPPPVMDRHNHRERRACAASEEKSIREKKLSASALESSWLFQSYNVQVNVLPLQRHLVPILRPRKDGTLGGLGRDRTSIQRFQRLQEHLINSSEP